MQVGKLADLVDIHWARLLAQFAPSCLEPSDQLFAAEGDRCWHTVGEDRALVTPQRNAAEPCYQWGAAVPFDADLEAFAWPVRCGDGGPVTARHFRYRGVMLAGQCFEHGGFGHPSEPVKSPEVTGQQVIFHQSPVLC